MLRDQRIVEPDLMRGDAEYDPPGIDDHDIICRIRD
jgi:hypothetical protein